VIKGVPEEKALQFIRFFKFLQSPKKPLPPPGRMVIGDWTADWLRNVEIRYTGQYPAEKFIQAVTFLSPSAVKIDTTPFAWRQVYHPTELGPKVIRQLLASHPDLSDGWLPAPDPMRRLTIAQFMKEVGWYAEAREELTKLKADAPWAWAKEATDRYDKLTTEIDAAETKWLLGEIERAQKAGMHQAVGQFLKGYEPKAAGAEELTKLAGLKATQEKLQPDFDKARRLLRQIIDKESGAAERTAHGAVAGGYGVHVSPGKTIPSQVSVLLEAAEAVYRELHPDTMGRVERFVVQAEQEEKRAAAKQPADVKADALLSLAVTGWLKGANGAFQDPRVAVQVWNSRKAAVAILRSDVGNDRAKLLDDYLKSSDVLEPKELAQIITLLPPVDAEDLANVRGTRVDPNDALTTGVYRIEAPPAADDREGVTYYIRLPREYHHGRPYPLVLALTHPNKESQAERMCGLLAAEADRNGYIVASVEWAPRVGEKKFDHSGKDHRLIHATLRDVFRKFQVNQDQVFAFGFGEGANFAFDLSMSRPDLFAGVVCMGPFPVHQFYQYYWKNAQKCPVYSVTGELASGSVEGLRKVYEHWLPLGFYSILSVYKGRGVEWFAHELPTIFDWMNRKTRVRGIQSLRLDGGRFEPWQSFRDTDARFYWAGATDLSRGNRFTKPEAPHTSPLPAEFFADLRNNEVIVSGVRGTRQITVWLERDMIDWATPLKVRVDGNVAGFKPRVMTPDLRLMFEELYRTGDRKMLFFGKLEFKTQG
jgi:dienelactone hydrolase